MNHAAKFLGVTLAVILVLFTLCSSKGAITSSLPVVPADEKWVNQSVPISDKMMDCVKKIFDAVPTGTFLMAHKVSYTVADPGTNLVLFSPTSKKEINLSEELHKIDHTATCTLSSDGSKILVEFSTYNAKGSDGYQYYKVVLNKKGDVLFGCNSDSVNYSDDLNYLAFYHSKSTHCVNVESQTEKVFQNKYIYKITSGYAWGSSISDEPKDVSTSSGSTVSPNVLWLYDFVSKKIFNIYYTKGFAFVESIKNNHAVLLEADGLACGTPYVDPYNNEHNTFYDFDLATQNSKRISGSTAKTLVNEPLSCGDFSAKIYPIVNDFRTDRVEIKDSKSNKTQVYSLDRNDNYVDFHWMEIK